MNLKIIIYIAPILFLFSCSKEEVKEEVIEDDNVKKITYKIPSFEHFYKTYEGEKDLAHPFYRVKWGLSEEVSYAEMTYYSIFRLKDSGIDIWRKKDVKNEELIKNWEANKIKYKNAFENYKIKHNKILFNDEPFYKKIHNIKHNPQYAMKKWQSVGLAIKRRDNSSSSIKPQVPRTSLIKPRK
mgnify:FL=1